jgi:hypothetical protein
LQLLGYEKRIHTAWVKTGHLAHPQIVPAAAMRN